MANAFRAKRQPFQDAETSASSAFSVVEAGFVPECSVRIFRNRHKHAVVRRTKAPTNRWG